MQNKEETKKKVLRRAKQLELPLIQHGTYHRRLAGMLLANVKPENC